jgi:hypothetical protein
MGLVEQWRRIEDELPEGWSGARLALEVPDERRLDRAAALLGPAGPGRGQGELRFSVAPGGGAAGPEAVRRLLARIQDEGIRGALRLVETSAAPAPEPVARVSAADAWNAALDTLPPDWSDLLCEVELTSSDHLDRGALLLAPINPYRIAGRSAFTFRAARHFGYGASPGMVGRCFARLDEDGIPASVQVLRALSDTHNVDTQGPVWRVGGKAT